MKQVDFMHERECGHTAGDKASDHNPDQKPNAAEKLARVGSHRNADAGRSAAMAGCW